MKILLTGAHGYIGSQLLPALLDAGHDVVGLVRSREQTIARGTTYVGDLLKEDFSLPQDIDAAYYLVHSMGKQSSNFYDLEARCARNFVNALKRTSCQHIIYLSGLSHGDELSEHMRSRLNVESILQSSTIPTTVLRAGIVIGNGSASFTIIRDLVEKLPIMICPRWVRSRCQPIAIGDVIFYLTKVLLNATCYNRVFEIGGPDILTYKEMLQRYAAFRKLHRIIIPIPVLTPRLSSYWLVFVTKIPLAFAQALVESLKTDSVVRDHAIDEVLPHSCMSYEEAIQSAREGFLQRRT